MSNIGLQPTSKGKIIEDSVVLTIGGIAFHGWESLAINRDIDNVADSFNMILQNKFEIEGTPWPIKPSQDVTISIDKERIITGRIDLLSPSFGADQTAEEVAGRSLVGDMVDCSHLGQNEFNNITVEALAKEIAKPFGIVVESDVTTKRIENFSIKMGETAFEAISRAARPEGLLWISTPLGHIRLTRASKARATQALEQGVNIKSGQAIYDDSKRFRDYSVRGQRSGLDTFFGIDAAQPQGEASDAGIARYRPLVLISEGSVDSEQAKARAEWEASTRLAEAIRVSVAVQGWRKRDGTLWTTNENIFVKSHSLGLNRELLITGVSFNKANTAGTITSLTLSDPQVYAKNPNLNQKKKSNIMDALGSEFPR